MGKTFIAIILLFSLSILMLKAKQYEEDGDELISWGYFLLAVVIMYFAIFFPIFI